MRLRRLLASGNDILALMAPYTAHRYRLTALAAFLALSTGALFGWGGTGHRIVNRLAAENLPSDLPAFMRTSAAKAEIEYLGPEPDRWRSLGEPELNSAQAPEHYIDLERADVLSPLPHRRYDYVAALYAAQPHHTDIDLKPEGVGFQPYVTIEVWQRLKAAMREYRTISAEHGDTAPVEQAILFYAGWLGHYVGDGSQPLHTTINHDGWVAKDNPNHFETTRGIHWLFEGTYVDANIKQKDVAPFVAPLQPISGDIFDAYMAYLRNSYTYINRTYEIENDRGFDGKGSKDARKFTEERIAAGASMLRDLIYAAWVESGKPVPERKY